MISFNGLYERLRAGVPRLRARKVMRKMAPEGLVRERMVIEHMRAPLQAAEDAAASTGSPQAALAKLRLLGLEDFGLFMISLPRADYPALSRCLPAMASAETQRSWTGADGLDLLRQTAAFTRIVENNFIRHTGRSLSDATILDFGCGYGRLLRMMYYFCDPDRIWGVDAWERSLETCREAGLLGNFALSDNVPAELPVDGTRFDLAFAFSVFTHLAPAAASACLDAVRASMKPGGIFIPTIRPLEFWKYNDTVRGTSHADTLLKDHAREGFAYLPHNGTEGETYGDITLDIDFLARPGWEILARDRSLVDPYQLAVILRAV